MRLRMGGNNDVEGYTWEDSGELLGKGRGCRYGRKGNIKGRGRLQGRRYRLQGRGEAQGRGGGGLGSHLVTCKDQVTLEGVDVTRVLQRRKGRGS